jgi:uncharacterized protein (TIGR03437 family)
MPLALLLLGLIVARCALGADVAAVPRDAPVYTALSIVNAADNQSGALAPNSIGTIYGVNLAYSTAGVTESDVQGGSLPVMLGASETTVFIDYSPAALYYVSPTQINFLVPPNLLPGPVIVYVAVDSWHGSLLNLTLARAAPGLFQLAPGTCQLPSGADLECAVATLADGWSVLTPSSPARPGDIVILWATGLGQTTPPAYNFQLPTAAAPLIAGANLEVLLDGVAVPSSAIEYAGVAPGYAGLYQINLLLPLSTGANPEIRLQLDGATSIPGVHLPVSP